MDARSVSFETPAPDVERAQPRRLRRIAVPLVACCLAGLYAAIVWSLPVDAFQRGMRVMHTVIAVAAALLVTGVWFFGMSGASRRARLLGMASLVLLAVGVAGSVRRVEFTGDMIPLFDFRWSAERSEILARHRAGQPPRPVSSVTLASAAGDITEYRGASRDGHILAEAPPDAAAWASHPPRPVWRQPVGGGYAAFVNVGEVLFTIEQRGEQESVVCYDAKTGQERWVHAYAALFHETLGGDGPRATPTVSEGRLYALGATGELRCLDAASGQFVWSVNILQANQAANLDWGMSGSPLVFDGKVVVNPGTQKGTADSHALVAFRASDGQLLWATGTGKAGYASPMLAQLADRRQILVFDADGLSGYDAETGAPLWQHPWKSEFDINAAQPVVWDEDRVLISSATGCALLQVAHTTGQWTVNALWQNRNLKANYANPVVHQGHAYGLDEGILVCLDLATGERKWKRGRYGHGQLLLWGDQVVVLAESGELVVVAAASDGLRELARVQAIEGRTWNNPILVRHRAFVRNHLEMACYDLSASAP